MGSDVYEHVNHSFIEQYISISVSTSLSPTDFFYKFLEFDLGGRPLDIQRQHFPELHTSNLWTFQVQFIFPPPFCLKLNFSIASQINRWSPVFYISIYFTLTIHEATNVFPISQCQCLHIKGKLAHEFTTCFLEWISIHLAIDKTFITEQVYKKIV